MRGHRSGLDAGAARRRGRRPRDRRGSAGSRRGSSPGCTSSIRTRPTSRRRSTGATTRRSRTTARSRSSITRSAPLFDRLASLPRPTLVIVTADHGESLGEHGELTHGMFAYEATLHVPLIVARVDAAVRRRRGRRRRSTRRSATSTSSPTVLDAVGAPPDASLPADRSLRPIVDGGPAPTGRPTSSR